MSENGPGRKHNLPEVFTMASLWKSIKLLPWCVSSAVPPHYISEALVVATWQGKNTPPSAVAPKPYELPTLGSSQFSLSNWHSSSPGPLLPDLPFVSTPPFSEFLAISTQKKWGRSSSGSPYNHHNKRTYVDSQEVKARSEHSSAQGGEDMHELILGTGTSFKQQGQELVIPPSSPTRSTTDLEDGTAARSLKSTWDQAFPDSESSREKVEDSNLDTASRDCISCSDTDEVSTWTVHKKYRKRVWASCRQCKGSLCTAEKDQWQSPGHVGTWPWKH